MQTEEPGGNRPALIEIMTVHEDGDTLGARYVLQQREDLPPGDRVERSDRFIREQQRGLSHERTRDGDALFLPAGQAADRLAALIGKADTRKQPLGLGRLCTGKQPDR